MLKIGSLFSGYGGLELAAELLFGQTDLRWVAERDPGACAVLTAHWPHVTNLGDLDQVDFSTVDPVDVLTAGYPCQGESLAGRRAGQADERWGWPHVKRAIRLVRPGLVLLENVPGHLSLGFGQVLADLASLGYVGSWICVRAADVGAPHKRERVFILAHPADTDRDPRWLQPVTVTGGGDPAQPRADPARPRADGQAGGSLLPTPTAADHSGPGHANDGGLNLRTAITLMPTPAASLGRQAGDPSPAVAEARRVNPDRTFGLDDAVALLPTPKARDTRSAGQVEINRKSPALSAAHQLLLPTPRATDGAKGGPNQRGSSGDLMLPSAVVQHLLPTPVVADSNGTRNATVNRRDPAKTSHSGWTLSDVAYAERWGRYADAITRWEAVTGRPAPDPTEPGTRGKPRLAPRFVEWMMALPPGWVTDHVGRNPALKCLGNGVVPPQAALAYAALLRTMP